MLSHGTYFRRDLQCDCIDIFISKDFINMLIGDNDCFILHTDDQTGLIMILHCFMSN